MAYPENNDLERAIKSLTIWKVWAAAHADGVIMDAAPAPERDGQYRSPFRDDGKSGSFSVCHDGAGYVDFGGTGESGNVWKFAAKCWANATKGELAKKLIALSGIVPTLPPKPTAPGAAPAAGEVDPALAAAARTIERAKKLREQEAAVYAEREKLVRAPSVKVAHPWPAFVRAHYLEGVEYLRKTPKAVEELANARGWPVEWAAELVEQGLVSYPWERGATPGAKWQKRQKAFLVQAPRFSREQTALDEHGYHQRFFSPAREGSPEKKGWLFVPSIPKNAPRSELERLIVQHAGLARKQTDAEILHDRPTLTQPLPFVLGDVQVPKLVVLLEGQWDAITFYGACGFFHDTTTPEGIAVFGIRGAHGLDMFLGHWAAWLERHSPRAWVLADNDAAGGSWRDAPEAEPGLPRPPGLAERLVAVGCRNPLVSWLKPGPWGKDFNDFYIAKAKAGQPIGPEKMDEWMRKVGIRNATGGWA